MIENTQIAFNRKVKIYADVTRFNVGIRSRVFFCFAIVLCVLVVLQTAKQAAIESWSS